MSKIETYHKPSNIRIQDEPSCFNNIVRVIRYRVTVEPIKEPVQVIKARLQSLWDAANYKNRSSVEYEAKKLGIKIDTDYKRSVQLKERK